MMEFPNGVVTACPKCGEIAQYAISLDSLVCLGCDWRTEPQPSVPGALERFQAQCDEWDLETIRKIADIPSGFEKMALAIFRAGKED